MKRVHRKGRKTRRKTRPKKQRGGAEILPVDELYGFKFPYVLTVTFSNGQTADGSIFEQVDTVQEPTVKWTPPDPSDMYLFRTLLCFDPDAKGRSWLHWLVVNATHDAPLSGETFISWEHPTPVEGTHRYYFCLFQHIEKVRPDSRPNERGYFDVRKFLNEYGMQPVADSMIRVVAPNS
jgi:phosphatidylethanolamine-binding protein (PEBP) family uncharacterized protein